MVEKRRFIRLKFLLRGEVETEAGSREIEILDFSRKGLKFYVPQGDFTEVDPLKLKAYLPTRSLPVSIQSRIRWIQPQRQGYEIGTEIEGMDLYAKEEILDFAYDKWKKDIKQNYA